MNATTAEQTRTLEQHRTVIEPSRRIRSLDLAELWRYRELLYFLVWRDVKVRYKQTALGAAWAILQPLSLAVVFTLLFGGLAGISSEGVPYPVFSFAGLLIWTFFAQAVSLSANSLVGSAHLVTKVFFPRPVIPLASVLANLVDLSVGLPVALALMVVYRIDPGLQILTLPLAVALAFAAALGVGLWLSALNVAYRDVRYVVPFMVQLWLFLTPVIYPASAVERLLDRAGLPPWLAGVNPMAGAVDAFRWSLLGTTPPSAAVVTTSVVVALILLVTGAWYFRSVERSFADVV